MHKLDRIFQNFGGIWGFLRVIAVGLALVFGLFAWIKCSGHPIDIGINAPENLEAWENMHKQDEERRDRQSERRVNEGTASSEDYDRYLNLCS